MFIESLRHDDGLELKILHPGGWCQTAAREDMTRSCQYQTFSSRARASSPTAFPGHLEPDKQRPASSFLFGPKFVNRRENFLARQTNLKHRSSDPPIVDACLLLFFLSQSRDFPGNQTNAFISGQTASLDSSTVFFYLQSNNPILLLSATIDCYLLIRSRNQSSSLPRFHRLLPASCLTIKQ